MGWGLTNARRLAVALLVVGCDPPATVEVSMPGPARARGAAAASQNAECEGCHLAEAEAWRASRHHGAATNEAYRHAHAIENSKFCSDCHAPEGVASLGVSCVTCHVTDTGAVLAALKTGAPPAPHPVARSARFTSAAACATCHEFAFPGRGVHDDADMMQTTVREHSRSPAADRRCASCHMPAGDHGFAQVRDPAWLARHLEVRVEPTDLRTLRVRLRQTDPAHALPTGDLFRRLEVGARSPSQEHRVHLARHFESGRGHVRRRLVRDDRVFDQPVDVELDVDCAAGPVRWWVTLQRVGTVGSGRTENEVTIESETTIASGDTCHAP